MKVAVVADAISKYNYFPAWYDYYSKTVGEENIFLFSYFEKIKNSIVLNRNYCDSLRVNVCNSMVEKLFSNGFDVVIKVDVDEFLVADDCSLTDYLANFQNDYATAKGFDVYDPNDSPLDFSKPLIQQRNFMYANTHVNKTCVIRSPLKWSQGFHFCNKIPSFGGINLIHMKFADTGKKNLWNKSMMSISPEIRTYYNNSVVDRSGKETIEYSERTEFNQHFISKIYNVNGIYKSIMVTENVNLMIPNQFKVF